MTNNICKIIYVGLVILLMTGLGSACGIDEAEFLHREITAGGNPVSGANCTLRLNNTQSYNNVTNANGWVFFCYNSTSTLISNTSCSKPTTYSAKLQNASCQKFIYYGNLQTLTFRLTNTLGESLEAQDCYVRVFYNDTVHPYLVEDLKTNLLYDNQTFIDRNGNYVRTSGVPITSSNGVYAISWPVRARDDKGYMLYRPNQDYQVRADCNGKVVNCSFHVGNYEPMHFDENMQWYEDNMQIVSFTVVVGLLLWFFIIPAFKKGGFWAGGGKGE
jgi:hypothetical protein